MIGYRKQNKKPDYIHAEGRVLYVDMAAIFEVSGAENFHAASSRSIGKSLGKVGLGLTFSADLRMRIANGYLNSENDCERFCNVWRNAVLNEKRLWQEFRAGVRPVMVGVN